MASSISKSLNFRSIKDNPSQSPKLVWQGNFEGELRARLAAIERKLDLLQPVASSWPACRSSAPAMAQRTPSPAEVHNAWAAPPCEVAMPLPGDIALPSEVCEETDEAVAKPALIAAASGPRLNLEVPASPTRTQEEEDGEGRFNSKDTAGKAKLGLIEDTELSKEMLGLRRQTTQVRKSRWWRRVMTKMGMDDTIQSINAALEEPQSQKGWWWVHNQYVSGCVSCVIMLNALFMGYSTSSLLAWKLGETPYPKHLFAIEMCFRMFFVLELILRCAAERWLFFFGPELKWNLLDMSLVLLSFLDMAIDQTLGFNASIGRILRMLRFFRLARLCKVVRQFDALRLIAYAILDSMGSLFWCFVLIFLVIYVFSVVFISATVEHLIFLEASQDPSRQLSQSLLEWYGGLFKAMLTLFMVVTGGVDWNDASRPLMEVDLIYMIFFLCFIFLMFFGVLNVVIGQFVAAATEIAARDQEALVKYELREWQVYAERIHAFFNKADMNKNGTLSWDEFKEHLKNPKVRALYQTLDLDVAQAHVLFDLLDADKDSSVTVEEFIDGCMRLKGQAKNIDLNMLLAMNKRLFDELSTFMQTSRSTDSAIQDSLDKLAAAQGGLRETSEASTPSPRECLV